MLNNYGKMLGTPTSLTLMKADDEGSGTSLGGKECFCQEANTQIDYSEFMKYNHKEPHFGFKNWNEWFLREFR